MTMNIEVIQRFSNQKETLKDEQALMESIFSNWTGDLKGLIKRLQLAVELKRSNPLYEAPTDSDDIDDAVYDSIVEEISIQCSLWNIDAAEISNELMHVLVLAGHKYYTSDS